jgi:hypothetical protein
MNIRGMWSAAKAGIPRAGSVASHADDLFMRLGTMGKKGKALEAKMASGAAGSLNEVRALGKRRAMIGGGIAGVGLMGQARGSGVTGTQPKSMGGATGY